jgi:hypothetical protein
MATESCVPWSSRKSPKCNVRPYSINDVKFHISESFHRPGVLHTHMAGFRTSLILSNSKMQELVKKELRCGIECRSISLYVLHIWRYTDHYLMH